MGSIFLIIVVHTPLLRHNNNKHFNGPRPPLKNSWIASSVPNSSFSARVQCQLCQKFGHTALECWHCFDTNLSSHINANSSQFYSSDNDSGEPSLLGTPSTLSDPLWYPDSGATHHITHDSNIFSSKTPYTGSEMVQLGNGQVCI